MTKNQSNMHPVAAWLFACAALVFAMVVVGAITRLTESGLSMVEWRPVTGILPPLDEAAWHHEFSLYQQSPEFHKKNFWMELGDFKQIFFWEWAHRLLGRLIGIAYGLPLAWFWLRGQIPAPYKPKLLALFLLGGLQGLMGWYMVQSGLINQPAVSHYRLAAHLGLAFLIFALLLWQGLSLIQKTAKPHKTLYTHGWIVLGTLILTIIWGAFTAGLDAGLIYNESFPKMGGRWLPEELFSTQPVWINFFEKLAGVQFAHRWLAMLTVAMVLGYWAHAQIKQHRLPVLHALAAMALIQLSLGIATLLSQVALPLAVLHQAGALTLLALLVISLRQLKPLKE